MKRTYSFHKGHNSSAFTIVELLIVVVIIGILAAIVIVAYNGVQKQAADSAVRSELAQMAKKLEIYKANNGRYPTSSGQLEIADIKVNKSNYRETNTDGSQRNNLYYIVSSSTHPDGVGAHYAIGTVPQNALTGTICLHDGTIIAGGNCGGGDATRTLISATTTETSWASTGYTSDTGWQPWTGN